MHTRFDESNVDQHLPRPEGHTQFVQACADGPQMEYSQYATQHTAVFPQVGSQDVADTMFGQAVDDETETVPAAQHEVVVQPDFGHTLTSHQGPG